MSSVLGDMLSGRDATVGVVQKAKDSGFHIVSIEDARGSVHWYEPRDKSATPSIYADVLGGHSCIGHTSSAGLVTIESGDDGHTGFEISRRRQEIERRMRLRRKLEGWINGAGSEAVQKSEGAD